MHDLMALQDPKELLSIYQDYLEPSSIKEARKRTICILDAKYKKVNLHEMVEKNCAHIMAEE